MATFFKRKATVVALAALSLSLAGGGIAAAAQPEAKPQPGVRHSTAQPPVTAVERQAARTAMRATLAPPAAGQVAWAVVAANGTLLQHSGNVVSSFRFTPGTGVSAGQYQVLLDYNVSAKAYVATIGTNDTANVPPAGEVSVAPRTLTPNAVFVQTRNSTGGAADRPFHLVIAN
ncbi:hypothetical protein ACFWRG_16090 [Micromonospora tulbaghiae]|uniref:Secreted protein n=1 Tax=Micromonospora tulbaghiae TaxID=479978 RepID=A0AAW4JUF4_9ACTN|nr:MULTISPECIES: hypothetical protein [Micromonospora]KAB1907522.1 hypothetical protein F8279_10485 [Micromonospora sp. AMSO1212t]MBO4142409.1 hypothetical protein [Micromonospora tulbaghiae]MDX5459360.1 hypothetical protein [Micromonospora tulbaghiae]SCE82877.1 hypothetical protein GA0070562_3135 [Micromonospora tulbaghiae]